MTSAFTAASNSCSTQPTSANVGTVVGDGISGSAYWTTWNYNKESGYQLGSQDQHALISTGADTTTTYTYGYAGNGTTQPTTLEGTTTTGPSGTTTGAYQYNTLGATTSRPTASGGQESLTWDDRGKLSTSTTTAGVSTYLYDASGDVIELVGPSTTTLYLPNQQIVLNNTADTTATTRFYPLPGGGEAVRTGTGANYSFVFTDRHNTATVQLNSSCIAPTWQQYTPYGAPRGTASTSWTDPNGFLDKPQDGPDNLTLIGAREYDTTLGRFISLDPILETQDPQQLDGYSYAGGNPIVDADPSGKTRTCPYGCSTPNIVDSCQEGPYAPGSQCNLPNDGSGPLANPGPVSSYLTPTNCVVPLLRCGNTSGVLINPGAGGGILINPSWTGLALTAIGIIATVVVLAAACNPAAVAGTLGSVCVGVAGTEIAGWVTGGATIGSDDGPYSSGGLDGDGADGLGNLTSCNSFSGPTQVLMADGTSKPIAKIKVGDKVTNNFPGTYSGAPDQTHTVTAVHITYTDHNYTDVTVGTPTNGLVLAGAENAKGILAETGSLFISPFEEVQADDGA